MRRASVIVARASQSVRAFLRQDEGAAMPEYALLVALIAVVAIAAVTLVGTNVSAKLNAVGRAIGAG